MTLVQTTQSNTQRVLDSFTIENSAKIYSSIRNGNDYTAAIDSDYFTQNLLLDGTLVQGSDCFYNEDSEGNILWRMTVPQTTFTETNTLNLTCTFDLLLPVAFAGNPVTELRIPIKVKTSYNLKN
ncbi:MAG: hypothetical protein ACYCYM_09720 [Saccharofermentanales bacterium]